MSLGKKIWMLAVWVRMQTSAERRPVQPAEILKMTGKAQFRCWRIKGTCRT
jgi:hypothetical protein